MPWDAKLVVIRDDKTHTIPVSSEPYRHRRGEVVAVHDWTGKAQTGVPNNTFVHVYITSVPDSITLHKAQEWLMCEHTHDTEFEFDGVTPKRIGRKKRLIPYTPLPNGVKNALATTGMVSVTWAQAKGYVKRRANNQEWGTFSDGSCMDDDEVLP